jgi:hypothetical protein
MVLHNATLRQHHDPTPHPGQRGQEHLPNWLYSLLMCHQELEQPMLYLRVTVQAQNPHGRLSMVQTPVLPNCPALHPSYQGNPLCTEFNHPNKSE